MIVFENELTEDVAAGWVDGMHHLVLKDADQQVDTVWLEVGDVVDHVGGLQRLGNALYALVTILTLFAVSQVDLFGKS